jgi:hypothetical protein
MNCYGIVILYHGLVILSRGYFVRENNELYGGVVVAPHRAEGSETKVSHYDRAKMKLETLRGARVLKGHVDMLAED